MTDEVSKRVRV